MDGTSLSVELDELQWKDTFTYDNRVREMVPVIQAGDIVELQLVCFKPQIVEWATTRKGARSLTSVPGTDGLHRISGPVSDRKQDRSGRSIVVVLDAPVPVVCGLSSSEEGALRTPARAAEWMSLEAILAAEISFADGPLYAPLVVKVVSIEPRAVMTDYFGNSHPGHYLLTILPAPGSTFGHSFSRLDPR
jgi:hypothetical protein